jgi:hypothetical protein
VSFAAITLCVASQRVIRKVSVYFVKDSVRKLLDTPSRARARACVCVCVCVKELKVQSFEKKLAQCKQKWLNDVNRMIDIRYPKQYDHRPIGRRKHGWPLRDNWTDTVVGLK